MVAIEDEALWRERHAQARLFFLFPCVAALRTRRRLIAAMGLHADVQLSKSIGCGDHIDTPSAARPPDGELGTGAGDAASAHAKYF